MKRQSTSVPQRKNPRQKDVALIYPQRVFALLEVQRSMGTKKRKAANNEPLNREHCFHVELSLNTALAIAFRGRTLSTAPRLIAS